MKKKTTKTKVMGAILSAAMVLSMLAGCGTTATTDSTTETATDSTTETATDGTTTGETAASVTAATETDTTPITVRIAVGKHAFSKCDDFNDKVAEEATGVHIEWLYVEDGAQEKVNTMLTADMPDAFLGLLSENQIAASMDSFLDISGMLEQYAPHVYADYNKMQSSNGLEILKWSDGSIRTLMTGLEVSYQNDAEAIQYINKDWLDQLGLEVPATVDELYDALCAFRDNDMNGNGDKTDEIPMVLAESNWSGHLMNMSNPWGIAADTSNDLDYYYKVQDGKVLPTVNTQEYRSYLEYMHKLTADGLLDKESLTQTNDQYYAKIKSGRIGFFSGWIPQSLLSEEESAKWVPVRALKAEDSITPVKSGRRNKLFVSRTGFVITANCENPERLLQWWDYLSSSTEMKYTVRYGEQGGCWDIDSDGKVIGKTPEGLTEDFTMDNYKFTYGMNDQCPLILKAESMKVDKEQAYNTWVREQYVGEVWDQLATEYLPIRFVDPAKIDERTFMETELSEYIANFRANSVLNGVDDAAWDAYVKQLDALQYPAWIQWYQDYVDGKF